MKTAIATRTLDNVTALLISFKKLKKSAKVKEKMQLDSDISLISESLKRYVNGDLGKSSIDIEDLDRTLKLYEYRRMNSQSLKIVPSNPGTLNHKLVQSI